MKKRLGIFMAVILVIIATIPICAAQENGGLLRIYFIDVGQADATIIICDDMILMIDGGNVGDSSLIYSMLRNVLGIKHIDYMIATHPHEDHVGGLSGALNACSVDVLYTPVLEYETRAFNSMIHYAHEHDTTILVPELGDTFYIGPTLVEILPPVQEYRDYNDMSIVVRITYGETTFLFTGDIGWDAERDLVEAGIDLSADVLKVGHHGSNTSSSYMFLREVMPSYAVISVGAGNIYDHPDEETLSRLQDVGAEIYRTDVMGTIECVSDGKEVTFFFEK